MMTRKETVARFVHLIWERNNEGYLSAVQYPKLSLVITSNC
jgi:hypothetical protein